MTAEVGVLNRNAVALAADSAVTLSLPEGEKIYFTNKLFMLSKYDPVAVMVYGDANMMDVPWETVIKSYRATLGTKGFGTLEGYAVDFLDSLEKDRVLFPAERQRVYCYKLVRSWLYKLKYCVYLQSKALVKTSTVSDEKLKALLREVFDNEVSHLRRHPRLPRFRRMASSALAAKWKDPINLAIKDELGKLKAAIPERQLFAACVMAIQKDLHWNGDSGVVFAGFGSREHLPSITTYKVGSVLNGRLRAVGDSSQSSEITPSNSAAVFAFAQRDMVELFMNGADSRFVEFLRDSFEDVMVQQYPAALDRLLKNQLQARRKRAILKTLREAGDKTASQFGSIMASYARQFHWKPIIDIVAYLPKHELAAMAEALVNLTSFKRHITSDAETVGGPVDVAVISKGDGFVWIKRKHYFDKELNQQFFANYYRA